MVAVVSTSGISGVIAPDGSVVPGSGIGELVAGRYVLELAQRDTTTVSDRLGPAPEWLMAAAGALALAAGIGGRGRRSDPPRAGKIEADPVNLRP